MTIKHIIRNSSQLVSEFLSKVINLKLHAKQLASITDAVTGIVTAGSLRLSLAGAGMAEIKGTMPKHPIKQLDRLLSNDKIETEIIQNNVAANLISSRSMLLVAMDWTVFHKDGHMTITLRLVTDHGRATPLLSKTVPASKLKGKTRQYENELLDRLRELVPSKKTVVLLADREFGTLNRFEWLRSKYGFDYVIRFKVNTTITNKNGKSKSAKEWLGNGKSRTFTGAQLARCGFPVEKLVVCKDKKMKGIWCLACSFNQLPTQQIKRYYSKRWSTETSYRDEKNIAYGMGLKQSRIKSTVRRDRLFLLSALAIMVMTMLGAISEKLGLDKKIKANTVKRRTHSLFSQGKFLLQWLRTNLGSDIAINIIKEFNQLCAESTDGISARARI